MELRHIFNIATVLSEAFKSDEMVGADTNDIDVDIKVSPATLFAIDQALYRQTHDGKLDGFEHNKNIDAKIDNIRFVLSEKEMSPKK